MFDSSPTCCVHSTTPTTAAPLTPPHTPYTLREVATNVASNSTKMDLESFMNELSNHAFETSSSDGPCGGPTGMVLPAGFKLEDFDLSSLSSTTCADSKVDCKVDAKGDFKGDVKSGVATARDVKPNHNSGNHSTCTSTSTSSATKTECGGSTGFVLSPDTAAMFDALVNPSCGTSCSTSCDPTGYAYELKPCLDSLDIKPNCWDGVLDTKPSLATDCKPAPVCSSASSVSYTSSRSSSLSPSSCWSDGLLGDVDMLCGGGGGSRGESCTSPAASSPLLDWLAGVGSDSTSATAMQTTCSSTPATLGPASALGTSGGGLFALTNPSTDCTGAGSGSCGGSSAWCGGSSQQTNFGGLPPGLDNLLFGSVDCLSGPPSATTATDSPMTGVHHHHHQQQQQPTQCGYVLPPGLGFDTALLELKPVIDVKPVSGAFEGVDAKPDIKPTIGSGAGGSVVVDAKPDVKPDVKPKGRRGTKKAAAKKRASRSKAAAGEEGSQKQRELVARLASVCEKMEVAAGVCTGATKILVDFYHAKTTFATRKTNSEAVVGACIFIACKNARVPRMFKEIGEVMGVGMRVIARVYKKMVAHKASYEARASVADPKDSLGRANDSLKLDASSLAAVATVLDRIHSSGLADGRSPASVLAAAILMVVRTRQLPVSDKLVAQAAYCSPITLRTVMRELSDSIVAFVDGI